MSGDSRSHLNRSTQRRFKWIFLCVSGVLVVILAPLVVSGELRLELAHRLNLVPGREIEQLYDGSDAATLITVPVRASSPSGRQEYRFRAVFIALETPGGVQLEFLDDDERISLPLAEYDFYSASFDGTQVLVQDTSDPQDIKGVLVDMNTRTATPMPEDAPYPVDTPGDWQTGSWEAPVSFCGAISTQGTFITCLQEPKLATYLAGDWELQVRVYGSSEDGVPVYRGRGLQPWVGWSRDDSRLYFQNEHGIWVAPVSIEMFS